MLENAAILRDVLNFWTFQHQKRHNFARLPQFLNLTTSKTTQFCETSFKNGKLSAELTASYQCVLRFFHSTCLKYFACHEKVMPGHTKCCTCHAKSSQRSDAPKCNPSQEISARTSQHLWWRCLLYCACHATCIFADLLQMSHACHRFWKCYETLMFFSHFWQGAQSLALATQNDIRTSKSAPYPSVFYTFDFEMCFAPQRCALFRHLNFQKCSERGVFLYILTWKCASRYNGVHFFDIAISKSDRTLSCFVHFHLEMCFAPQRCAIFRLSSGQMAPHPPL